MSWKINTWLCKQGLTSKLFLSKTRVGMTQCLSPPMRLIQCKWVPTVKITWQNAGCDGLASHPGEVAILLVTSCCGNKDKLGQFGLLLSECRLNIYLLFLYDWQSIRMTCMTSINLTPVFKAKHNNIKTSLVKSNKPKSKAKHYNLVPRAFLLPAP